MPNNSYVCDNLMDATGKTPLVALKDLGADSGVHAYAKLESFNPGGSAKDRTAAAMVEDARQAGLLEQLVHTDFELLSISYFVSEIFLISLYLMLQELKAAPAQPSATDAADEPAQPSVDAERCHYLHQKLERITLRLLYLQRLLRLWHLQHINQIRRNPNL